MMNGYTYSDLLGRSGKPLVIQVDGRRTVFHGEPAQPAQLRINGADAQPSTVVQAGDQVLFTPGKAGSDCRLTAEELMQRLRVARITVNGVVPDPSQEIVSGDCVVITQTEAPQPQAPPVQPTPEETAPLPPPPRPPCTIFLNNEAITLPAKSDGAPYYVMDFLERSGIDFQHVQRPVVLHVNGAECTFQQVIKEGDRVEIGYADEAVEL